MRTTGHELRSEAAIYAEGTGIQTSELVREYNCYAEDCEMHGTEPDDFQRWFESRAVKSSR
jgi:hypothetical protein